MKSIEFLLESRSLPVVLNINNQEMYKTPFEYIKSKANYVLRIKSYLPDVIKKAGKIEEVPLRNLYSIQKVAFKKVVDKFRKHASKNYPLVAIINGDFYLIDGYHRSTAAWLNGKNNVIAKVYDFGHLDAPLSTKQYTKIMSILGY